MHGSAEVGEGVAAGTQVVGEVADDEETDNGADDNAGNVVVTTESQEQHNLAVVARAIEAADLAQSMV